MSLSVTQTKSGFLPVGAGRTEYIFAESVMANKTNYRVRITLFGTSLPSFDFYADDDGNTIADIGPMLRALCTMSPTGRFAHSTYVVYQGLWEEGSYSPVYMGGYIIRAYAGANNYLNFRDQVYLSSSDGQAFHGSKIYVWKDRPAYIDFAHDDSLDPSCEVVFVDSDAVPNVIDTFNGSAFGFESFSYDEFESSGTIFIRKVSSTVYTSIEVVYMGEECENAIFLKWLNNYGGLSVWLFDIDQIFDLSPDELGTPPRYRVVARNIDFEQFALMAELKKPGPPIGDNKKYGAYVVDATTEDEVNVYVEPEVSTTRTRNETNSIEIMLRYPSNDIIEI